MPDIFNPSFIISDIPAILKGLPVTLEIVVISAVIGWVFGLLLALVKMYKVPVLYQICGVFVSFTRGTPELVQLFLAFYGIPVLLQYTNYYWGTGISVSGVPKMLFVLVAFTNITAAYSAESFRATLEGASFISILKWTSLAFVVSVVDMTSAGQLAASRTYRYLEMYIALAALYWILSGLFSWSFRVLEKHLKRNERVIVDNEPATWAERVRASFSEVGANTGLNVQERKLGYGLTDLQPAQAV